MEVSEESLFKTLEGLNTGEHQIKQWMGLGQGKEILLHTKVTGLWNSFLQDFVETPNPNRLQNGADKFMEFTLNGYNEIWQCRCNFWLSKTTAYKNREGPHLTRFCLFIFNTGSCPTHLLLDTIKAESKILQTFTLLEEAMLTLWTLSNLCTSANWSWSQHLRALQTAEGQ